MAKRICIFTGTRAEYGLLNPLMTLVKAAQGLTLRTIVSGAHLETAFGMTYKEIEQDGFKIDAKVKILSRSDSPQAICEAMGRGMKGYAQALIRLAPDCLVVLGDRFETFTAAAAALVCRIPIVHLHGGEATFGVIDEAFRHSITKMSALHCVATEEYRRRVIQLGEDPDRVFNVGAIGLDNIKNLKLLSKEVLEKELGISFKKRNLLITFHPATLQANANKTQVKALFDALDNLDDTLLIFTKGNADTDGRIIHRLIDAYVKRNKRKAAVFTSLGQLRYLSVLQYVDAVVGNSSSGIIEAPSFKIATINIGDRQEGRVKTASVIDCEPTTPSITWALSKLYLPAFQREIKSGENVYGDGESAPRILKILKGADFTNALKKKFYNL